MNSLEWVNVEITKWQEILKEFEKQLIEVKGTRNEQVTLNHIEFYKLRLNYLHQIKSELEAWEVMKKHLTITLNGGIKEIIVTGIDYEGQKNSLFIYSKEGVPIIEKALEVEE
jgi:hypothetical protein